MGYFWYVIGVFESPNTMPVEYQSSITVPPVKERRSSRTEGIPADLPTGVYGVGVKSNSLEKQPSTEEDEEGVSIFQTCCALPRCNNYKEILV